MGKFGKAGKGRGVKAELGESRTRKSGLVVVKTAKGWVSKDEMNKSKMPGNKIVNPIKAEQRKHGVIDKQIVSTVTRATDTKNKRVGTAVKSFLKTSEGKRQLSEFGHIKESSFRSIEKNFSQTKNKENRAGIRRDVANSAKINADIGGLGTGKSGILKLGGSVLVAPKGLGKTPKQDVGNSGIKQSKNTGTSKVMPGSVTDKDRAWNKAVKTGNLLTTRPSEGSRSPYSMAQKMVNSSDPIKKLGIVDKKLGKLNRTPNLSFEKNQQRLTLEHVSSISKRLLENKQDVGGSGIKQTKNEGTAKVQMTAADRRRAEAAEYIKGSGDRKNVLKQVNYWKSQVPGRNKEILSANQISRTLSNPNDRALFDRITSRKDNMLLKAKKVTGVHPSTLKMGIGLPRQKGLGGPKGVGMLDTRSLSGKRSMSLEAAANRAGMSSNTEKMGKFMAKAMKVDAIGGSGLTQEFRTKKDASRFFKK